MHDFLYLKENTSLHSSKRRIMDVEDPRAFGQSCSLARDFNNVRATLFYFAAIVSRAACYPTSVVHFHFPDTGKNPRIFSGWRAKMTGRVPYIPLVVLESIPIIDLVRLKILDPVSLTDAGPAAGSVFTILWQTFTLYWFTCRSACLCPRQFQRRRCAILRSWFHVTVDSRAREQVFLRRGN